MEIRIHSQIQRLHLWSLGMDKWFHLTIYNGCNYLSILGLKLNHVSEKGPRRLQCTVLQKIAIKDTLSRDNNRIFSVVKSNQLESARQNASQHISSTKNFHFLLLSNSFTFQFQRKDVFSLDDLKKYQWYKHWLVDKYIFPTSWVITTT